MWTVMIQMDTWSLKDPSFNALLKQRSYRSLTCAPVKRASTSTVRASVFSRHQFFGTPEHYGKAHGSLLSGWMNYNYTACCWFPTSSNILILPSQFWQIRFESCWLHCFKVPNTGAFTVPLRLWSHLHIKAHPVRASKTIFAKWSRAGYLTADTRSTWLLQVYAAFLVSKFHSLSQNHLLWFLQDGYSCTVGPRLSGHQL